MPDFSALFIISRLLLKVVLSIKIILKLDLSGVAVVTGIKPISK